MKRLKLLHITKHLSWIAHSEHDLFIPYLLYIHVVETSFQKQMFTT